MYELAAELGPTLMNGPGASVSVHFFVCTGQKKVPEKGYLIITLVRYRCLTKLLAGEAGLEIDDDAEVLLSDLRDVWLQALFFSVSSLAKPLTRRLLSPHKVPATYLDKIAGQILNKRHKCDTQ